MGCGPSQEAGDRSQSRLPSPRKGWEEGSKVKDNHRPCWSTRLEPQHAGG